VTELLINVDVDDLEKAIAFYKRALDLREGRRFDFGVELVGGSSPLYLLVKEEGTQATPTSSDLRRYRRHWTPVHLDAVVDDIAEAVGCALGAGATLEGEIRSHSWGHIATMADPFGHGLCLIQFIARGYDEIALPDRSPRQP
jgi:catechol 2,3-dioxygenase-like lactoylglutathione lyase family enzyme